MIVSKMNQYASTLGVLASLIILSPGCFGGATDLSGEGISEISGQFAGLSYVETLTGDAGKNAELPMLIAMHYMSGSPATSIEDYAGLNMPIRLLSLQGPHNFGDGFSWFPDGYYDLDAEAQLEVTIGVANQVASFIREAIQALPTKGKPILVGYSQGADLTHMIALREPGLILAGLPMGGRFPVEWSDTAAGEPQLPSKIVLFHGATDTAVDVRESLAAATYYAENGVTVVLHVYAGVGHSYPAQMKADYQRAIEQIVQSGED